MGICFLRRHLRSWESSLRARAFVCGLDYREGNNRRWGLGALLRFSDRDWSCSAKESTAW
jgi:hypothetical protein